MTNINTETPMATTNDSDRNEVILEFAEFAREQHQDIYDDLATE